MEGIKTDIENATTLKHWKLKVQNYYFDQCEQVTGTIFGICEQFKARHPEEGS